MAKPTPSPQALETVRAYCRIKDLLPAHWSEGKIMANGIRHHYFRTGGDKPPLLLLHGFLEGALSWLRTARILEQDYDLIMADARGHGLSDRIATGFTQELLTEDVAGVIRALGLGPTRLLGFSQGGTTAVHVADSHPELVRSFVLAGWSDGASMDFTQSEGYKDWLRGYVAWLERLKSQTHEERMVSALSQQPPGAPLLPEDEYVPMVENCARLDLDLVRLGDTLWASLVVQV